MSVEITANEQRKLADEGRVVVAPLVTVADLTRACVEAGLDPSDVMVCGRYHARTDDQGGIAMWRRH